MDPENIELKDFDPRDDVTYESRGQKDEEDTSFNEMSHRLLDNDGVLEMDESNNLFVRLKDLQSVNEGASTSTFNPNDIPNVKRDAGVIKRSIISDKKQFISKVFGIKVNKGAGSYSKLLYDELRITAGKNSGKINGAEYKGKKILILMKTGKMVYSKGKANSQLVMEFENVLIEASKENKKTPASIVEDHIPHEISEETADNIVKKAADDLESLADHWLDVAERHANELRSQNNINISPQEIRELIGALFKNWDKLMEVGDKDLIKVNLKALDIEKQSLKRKALEAKALGDTNRESIYNTMAKVVEIKADEGRLRINQKPKGNLAVEILKEEADVNENVKFDKFKKWAKKNLLGLSAITITVAGILVTIFSTARTVVKGGANALDKFAKAVANITKKFGPIIGAVGSILASVLSTAGAGLMFLAQNIWLLAVALTYFIYNEYKKRGKTTK